MGSIPFCLFLIWRSEWLELKKRNVLLLALLLCIDVMLFPFFLYKNLIWIWIGIILFSLAYWPFKLLLTHKMELKQESLLTPKPLTSWDSNLIDTVRTEVSLDHQIEPISDKTEWMTEEKPKEALSLLIEETKEGMLELTTQIIPEISSSETNEITKTINLDLVKDLSEELLGKIPEELVPEEFAKDIILEKSKDLNEEEIGIDLDKKIETEISIETIVIKTFPDIKTGINIPENTFPDEGIYIKQDSGSKIELGLEEIIEHQEDKLTDNENRECEVVETQTPEQNIKIIGLETNWLSQGKPPNTFRKDNLPDTTLTEMIMDMIDQGFEAKNAGQLLVAVKWFNAALNLHPAPDLAVSIIMDVFILWKTSGHRDLALERLELFWGEYQDKLSPDLRRQFNSWLAKENLQEGII